MNNQTKNIKKKIFLACPLFKPEANKGKIAILQIMILLIGVVAFSYLVSGYTEPVEPSPPPAPSIPSFGVEKAVKNAISNAQSPPPSSSNTPAPGIEMNIIGKEDGEVYTLRNNKFFNEAGEEVTRESVLGTGTSTIAQSSSSNLHWWQRTIKAYSSKWEGFKSALGWAAAAYGAGQLIGSIFGLNSKETNILSISLAAGVGIGRGIAVAGKTLGKAWGWGGGITIALLLFWPAKGDKYVYSCKMWDAPVGGRDCHLCNNQKTSDGVNLPCSEYQCKSLGQSCELVNKGTGKEKCVAINIRDSRPPIIETDDSVLPEGYSYSPDNAINPPDRGVKVIAPTSDKCLPTFTPIQFGIKLNEVAKCKADKLRGKNFSEMSYYLDNGLSLENHTINLSLPGVSNLEQENITLENGGDFDLYIKCRDYNGNSNDADFVFEFCVQKGPDNMPPEVVDTSVSNNMPIAVGQDKLPLIVYVSEPAECKWSTEDKSYESMENQMNCEYAQLTEQGFEKNGRLVYLCNTTLTGLKDKQENKFYFRCKDQPKLKGTDKESNRNANSQSYEFVIFGTQPLVIDKAGPNGEVIDSTENVKVVLTAETSAGYKDGEAICSFREKGTSEDFIQFHDTGSYNHSTELHLPEGSYEYYIKCVDLGGNSDTSQVNFSVKSDINAPVVTRLYKAENVLKIITDEESECVYDTTSCNYVFENGVPINTDENKKSHSTDWNVKTKFYIKCKDSFGNEPNPDECSIIAKPL